MNHSTKKAASALILCSMLALSACGTDKADRTASGAGIGAATGAVLGAAVAGDPWAGAAVGGAVGGVAGGAIGSMTDSNNLNLGKPWWR